MCRASCGVSIIQNLIIFLWIFHVLSMKWQVTHKYCSLWFDVHMSAVNDTRAPQFLNISRNTDLCSLKASMQSSLMVVLETILNMGFKLLTNFRNPLYSTIENGRACWTIMFASSLLDTSWLKFQPSKTETWGDDVEACILATNLCMLFLASHVLKCLRRWLVPELREAGNTWWQCWHCPSAIFFFIDGIKLFPTLGF